MRLLLLLRLRLLLLLLLLLLLPLPLLLQYLSAPGGCGARPLLRKKLCRRKLRQARVGC